MSPVIAALVYKSLTIKKMLLEYSEKQNPTFCF